MHGIMDIWQIQTIWRAAVQIFAGWLLTAKVRAKQDQYRDTTENISSGDFKFSRSIISTVPGLITWLLRWNLLLLLRLLVIVPLCPSRFPQTNFSSLRDVQKRWLLLGFAITINAYFLVYFVQVGVLF